MASRPELATLSSVACPPTRIRHHILSIYGTELPPNLLLMAKLVVLAFVVLPFIPVSDPFLPFFAPLDAPLFHRILHPLLAVTFVGGAFGLLFNFAPRLCAFAAGTAVLISIVASKPFYSNNMLYAALLLLLTGLYEPKSGPWMIRLQAVTLYLGAGLNKLLEADWRSGQFFQHWFGETHHHAWFLHVGALLPPLTFAKMTSWSIILVELAFVPALLYFRTRPLAMWAVIAYHTAIVAMTGSTFGMFYYSIAASMLAFADWPECPFRLNLSSKAAAMRLKRLQRWLDPDRVFVLTLSPQTKSSVLCVGKNCESGVIAWLHSSLLCPATYFFLLFLVKLPESILHVRRPITVTAVLMFAPLALRALVRNGGLRFVSQSVPNSPNRTTQTHVA